MAVLISCPMLRPASVSKRKLQEVEAQQFMSGDEIMYKLVQEDGT